MTNDELVNINKDFPYELERVLIKTASINLLSTYKSMPKPLELTTPQSILINILQKVMIKYNLKFDTKVKVVHTPLTVDFIKGLDLHNRSKLTNGMTIETITRCSCVGLNESVFIKISKTPEIYWSGDYYDTELDEIDELAFRCKMYLQMCDGLDNLLGR